MATTVNRRVSARFTRRLRMSTSGLRTSVTPPVSLCVSNSGSELAPGRRGPMIHVPSTTAAPPRMAAGSITASGWRGRPSAVRGGWAKRIRSVAAARKPVATRAIVSATRCWSAPSAATNTNSTAPGTSASPRARAWKANVSAVKTAKAVPMAASSVQPPTYSTGATACAELVAHEAEVGPRDVPRLAGREDGGERLWVADPRHRPDQRGGGDGDGQERVDVESAQQQ